MEKIFSLKDIQMEIDTENIPTQYCWSGYTHSTAEFEEKNFYHTYADGHKILICAAENAVALCDYLSNELLRLDCIHDLGNIYSPDYDIWFFLYFEQDKWYLEDFPSWLQDIMEILIDAGIVKRYSQADEEFFILSDPDYYLSNPLPEKISAALEQKCRENAFNYWVEQLADYDFLFEMPEPECSKWGQDLFNQFKTRYADIEINAGCGPNDGPGVGFGVTFAHDQWPSDDTSWIYEGIADSMAENWEEFEDIAEKAKTKCKEYYWTKNLIPKSKEEVENVSLQIISEIMGPCSIEYDINGEPVDLTSLVDDEDVSLAMYQCISDNFGVPSEVFYDLEKEMESNDKGQKS